MADKKISALPAATTPLAGTEVLPIVQGGTTDQVSVANLTAGRAVSAASLTTTGNIGAGTSSPGYRLTATGVSTPGFVTALAIENPSTNAASEVRQEWRAGGSSWGYITASYNSNSPYMAFGVSAASAAPTERLRITDAGNLLATDGNFVLGTAGKGIDFSANTHAPGMTSELLNWYETGTWTPSVGGDATYTARSGTYTRIGNVVIVQFEMTINVLGTGATGTVYGLPFTQKTGAYQAGAISYWSDTNTGASMIGILGTPNTTNFSLTAAVGAVTTAAYPFAAFKNGTYISGSFTYFV